MLLSDKLLGELITNAGKVLTHRVLLQRIWGPEYGGESEYLRVYINRLRQKLEADPANPRYFLTEPGVGYRFAPESEPVTRKRTPLAKNLLIDDNPFNATK